MFKFSKLSIKYFQPNQRGVILLLTILILVGILATAFGVTSLMIGEIKMTREIPWALKAYYAAEVGVEKKLYDIRKNSDSSNIGSPPDCFDNTVGLCLDTSNTVCYSVNVIVAGPTCTASSYCIKSYGCYKRIKRSIEVSY